MQHKNTIHTPGRPAGVDHPDGRGREAAKGVRVRQQSLRRGPSTSTPAAEAG